MTAKRRPTADEWRLISDLFDSLALIPANDRGRALESRQIDPFIKHEVESLLAASAKTGVLDTRAPTLGGRVEEVPAGETLTGGAMIGAFRIEKLIGRGGAGEVYLAERQGDFTQRVALKLLRPEAAALASRFEAERRLLSQLEHPGIARLIDGGTAPDGRLFMAMEYVDGEDIARWCEAGKANLDTRLRLFREVCAAVAYAHRQLIVHRDLKPSNILVDRDGRVRLLDFGVAGLAGTAETGGVVLTPEYAAPEQFQEKTPNTLVDVYGLGATLFELLTGRGAWRFKSTPMPAVLHRLLHGEAPPPVSVAAGDSAPPPVPPSALKGDLDAIVAKAMHRDPAARYQSVEDLADDIDRHLTHRPVAVRAGSRLYRFGRFVRRNPVAIAASAAAVIALIAGATGILLQMRATAVERDIAREEATRAEAINDAISLMFGDAGERGKATTATAKELLDMSAARLIESIDAPNLSQAAQVVALAELYAAIDDVVSAEALLMKALEKGVAGSDPVMTAELKLQAGVVKAAKGEAETARRLLAEAQPVWDASPERFRVQRLEAIAAEASLRAQAGDLSTAIQLLLDSLPESERAYPPSSREILQRYVNLALHLFVAGRLDESETMLNRAERSATEGGRLRTAPALMIITMRGMLAGRRGDHAAMERYMQQAVDLRRELFGPSAALAVELAGLGTAMLTNGKPAEALPVLLEAASMMEAHLGKQPGNLPVYASILDAMVALGKLEEADAITREADPLSDASGPTLAHGMYLRARAGLRLAQGRLDECEADVNRTAEIYKTVGPPADPLLPPLQDVRERLAAARAAAN